MAVSRKNLLKIFGAHLRTLRVERGLTQVELAARADKDFQSIQRYEHGIVSPNLFALYKLAEGLDVEMKTLVDFSIGKSDTKKKRQ